MKNLRPAFLLLCLTFGFTGAPAVPPSAAPDSALGVVDGTPGIIVDDADRAHVEITAYWKSIPAEEMQGAYGPTVLSDEGVAADGVVRFKPDLQEAGCYEVFLYWPALRDTARQLATRVPVTVRHAAGAANFTINMREQTQVWKRLGTFPFEPGKPAYAEIRNDEADGIVLADAVRFRPADRSER